MPKMIQVHDVPDTLYRELKARAGAAGVSLSEYLLPQIREIAEQPAVTALRQRLHSRKPVLKQIDTARLVRQHRDA
jgi:hypothetical protein